MVFYFQIHTPSTGVFKKVHRKLSKVSFRSTSRRYSRQLKLECKRIAVSELFDVAWYLAQYPDVAAASVDPISHYVISGAKEGCDPNPLFDTDWYLAQYPDVAAAGVNPLWHYLVSGAKEGRDPNPLFDTGWYLTQFPDVANSNLSPLEHYFAIGVVERPVISEFVDPRKHSVAAKPAPVTEIETHAIIYDWQARNSLGNCRRKDFVAISHDRPPTEHCDVKLIAYFLPQFHPIPENNRWWGDGFTEWNNVARAFPMFEGHYQPRIPGELGYYDLRQTDVMRRQAELASLYGISAFCFHFYWFAGKPLLELPVKNYLQDKTITLPFCLCWANENWTRRWDGSEHELLIAQQHSPEDDIQFIHHLKQYFSDPRYLKVAGKPVLTIYRPALLPDPSATVQRWRAQALEMGFPGLYLIATNACDFEEYDSLGFDALSEFPPHGIRPPNIQRSLIRSKFHKGMVYAYPTVVALELARKIASGTVHPGVFPSWDNTPRQLAHGRIFHGSSPQLFKKWLHHAFNRARSNRPGERLVFIHAWNEWAEGAYLEPDQCFGYAYLDACASTIRAQTTHLCVPKTSSDLI